MGIQVAVNGNGSQVRVVTPYNPSFAPKAKRLGGRWNDTARCWTFDSRDIERVRSLCMDLFGEDGRAPAELCTLRVVFEEIHSRTCEVRICGRQVARVFGRDSGAKLGEGIVLESGKFGSAGSMKNPAIVSDGCTVLIRDIPRTLVEKAFESGDWGFAIASVECVIEGEAAIVETLAAAPNMEELASALDASILKVALEAEAAVASSTITRELRDAIAAWRSASNAVIAAGGAT